VASSAIAGVAILSLWFRQLLATAPDGGIGSESEGSTLPGAALAGLLSAVALVVPLVFTIAWADVFVLPKITTLRVALLAGLALLVLGRQRVYPASSTLVRRIVDLAVIAFTALTCLATAVSVDPGLSLVGRTEQYQGLVTTLLYVAFFFLAREALTTPRHLRVFAAATVAGSAIVGGYAVLQQFKLDPVFHTLDKGRVFSTFGQAEWLGAYLVIGLALGAGLLWQVRGPRRLVALVSLGVILIALLLTLSRGAYLGLAAGAAVFAIAMIPGARPNRRWLAALPILAVVVGAALLFAPVRDEARVMVSRATSTTDLSEGSIADRLDLWQVGAEIAIDHPLLGTGPETYTELFPQYRERMPVSRQTFWMAYSPESPHNVYLAVADGEGLPALAAYLIFIGAVLWQLARSCARAPDRATRALLAAVLAAAVGHLVADMFMTADVTGSWLIWLLLGAAVGYAEHQRLDRAPAAT
jgi:O-antigen ligase